MLATTFWRFIAPVVAAPVTAAPVTAALVTAAPVTVALVSWAQTRRLDHAAIPMPHIYRPTTFDRSVSRAEPTLVTQLMEKAGPRVGKVLSQAFLHAGYKGTPEFMAEALQYGMEMVNALRYSCQAVVGSTMHFFDDEIFAN